MTPTNEAGCETSSPSLPSPSTFKLNSSKAPLGSREAPIPLDAPSGFFSAAKLVTKEQLQQDYAPRSREASETPSVVDLNSGHPSEPVDAVSAVTKGKLKRPTRKLASMAAGLDDVQEEPALETAVPKRPRKRTIAATSAAESAGLGAPPASKRGRPKKTTPPENSLEDAPAAPTKRPRKKTTQKGVEDDEHTAVSNLPLSRNDAVRTDTTRASPDMNTHVHTLNVPKGPISPRARKFTTVPHVDVPDTHTAEELIPQPSEIARPSEYEADSIGSVRAAAPTQTPTTNKLHQSVSHTILKIRETLSTDSLQGFDNESAYTMGSNRTPTSQAMLPSFQHRSNYDIPNDVPARVDAALGADASENALQSPNPAAESQASEELMTEDAPSESIDFAQLVGSFGYQHQESGDRARPDGEPPVKRRRIETAVTANQLEKKKKSPKRKPSQRSRSRQKSQGRKQNRSPKSRRYQKNLNLQKHQRNRSRQRPKSRKKKSRKSPSRKSPGLRRRNP